MKVQVGQRAKVPDLEFRAVMAFASMCCTAQIPGTRKILRGMCRNCEDPVDRVLSEDIETGQVWLEGPDNCPTCHFRLSAEDPPDVQLSQEMIERLFGKF